MQTPLNKFFKFLLVLLFFATCKGQDDKTVDYRGERRPAVGTITPAENESIQTKGYLKLSSATKLDSTQNQYVINKASNEKYQEILLYKYLKRGINKNNVTDASTVTKIENILNYYITQNDFYRYSFFKRESKIINNSIDSTQLRIWYTCNEKLNFISVIDENILYDDWSYPYRQIPSLKHIAMLYKNKSEEYGHTYKIEALPQQMALYLYFLPWKKRKIIYEEIDLLKKELKKSNH